MCPWQNCTFGSGSEKYSIKNFLGIKKELVIDIGSEMYKDWEDATLHQRDKSVHIHLYYLLCNPNTADWLTHSIVKKSQKLLNEWNMKIV